MGLCLADSLIVRRGYDGSDVRIRFWNWWFQGYNNAFRFDSLRSTSVGLGGNIANSFDALKPHETPPPRFESKSEDAGVGSLMRLGPVPVFFHREPLRAAHFGAESSRTTHPGGTASEACAFLAYAVAKAILAEDRGPSTQDTLAICRRGP